MGTVQFCRSFQQATKRSECLGNFFLPQGETRIDVLNSKTIVRNTAWYGLENGVSFVLSLFTSIAIARTLGPSKMGYIIYVSWVVQMISSLGGVGIPATTRKYMAEFLGSGDQGTSRHIYLRTLLLQGAMASIMTGCTTFWVFRDAAHEYRSAALMLALSIWPAMMNFISAQANVAAEHLSANLPGSIVSTCTFFIVTCLTVIFHWGVNGIAAGMLAMRSADFLVRLIPTARRILGWEIMCSEPEGLNSRMLSFAGQSVIGMLLALIVWDRSEVVLLRHLSSSIQQVAFYSVAFSLAERLLIVPSVFGSATGATIFAQYGRDKTKLPALTSAAFRYHALVSIPMHAIAMALAASIVVVLYGAQYRGAITVCVIAPLLCLPKAFLAPIQNLFESTEEQRYFIVATAVAAVIDIAVASYLIPQYGAVGACLGSGAAQTAAVVAMWTIGIRRYKIRLPVGQLFKLTGISAITALASYYASRHLPPVLSLIVGGATALVLFAVLCYVFRVLEQEDCRRFRVLAALCPRVIRLPMENVLRVISNRLENETEPTYEVKL